LTIDVGRFNKCKNFSGNKHNMPQFSTQISRDDLTFSCKSSHEMYTPTLTLVGAPATATEVLCITESVRILRSFR